MLLQEGKLPNPASFHALASKARCQNIKVAAELEAIDHTQAKAKAKAKAKTKAKANAKPKAGAKKKGKRVAADSVAVDDTVTVDDAAELGSSQAAAAPGMAAAPVPKIYETETSAAATAENPDQHEQAAEPANQPANARKLKELFSAMQAAAIALSSERNSLGMDIIHFLVAPIRRYYTITQAALRAGPNSICNFFANLAVGEMHKANVEIWLTLQTPEILETCGLVLEPSCTLEDMILPGDTIMLEQDCIASLMDSFALNLVAERVDESVTHEADFIARCAGLFHPRLEQHQQTLQDLKSIADSYLRATSELRSRTVQSIVSRSHLNGSIEKACAEDFLFLYIFIRCGSLFDMTCKPWS